MSEHICIHEQDFGQLLAIQTRIIKEFYGNGGEGISKSIPKMQVQLASLTEAATGQATAISALAKAVTEIRTERACGEKEKLNARQRAQIIIASIIGASGVVVSLIFNLI